MKSKYGASILQSAAIELCQMLLPSAVVSEHLFAVALQIADLAETQ